MNSIATYNPNRTISVPKFYMPVNLTVSNTSSGFDVEENIDHKADPIKSMDDIIRVRDYLMSKERYRDLLIFIMGINFGLRCSDLMKLRFGDIITEDCEYRNPVLIRESKTRKPRKVYINEAVSEAFQTYIASLNTNNIDLNQFLFEGYKGNAMTRRNVDYILRGIMRDLNLPYNCGTHMLRKTFAYWTLTTAKDKTRALYYLQKALNHSSSTVTLFYAGITDDEIMDTSMNLNLGYRNVFDVEQSIVCSV